MVTELKIPTLVYILHYNVQIKYNKVLKDVFLLSNTVVDKTTAQPEPCRNVIILKTFHKKKLTQNSNVCINTDKRQSSLGHYHFRVEQNTESMPCECHVQWRGQGLVLPLP